MVEVPQGEVSPEAVDIIYRVTFKSPLEGTDLEEFRNRFPQLEGASGLSPEELGLTRDQVESVIQGAELDQPTRTRYTEALLARLSTYGINSDELIDFLKPRLNPPLDSTTGSIS